MKERDELKGDVTTETLIQTAELRLSMESGKQGGAYLVLFTGAEVGNGDANFGRALRGELLDEIKRALHRPHAIIFLNSAVESANEEKSAAILQAIEREGVKVLWHDSSCAHYCCEALPAGKKCSLTEIWWQIESAEKVVTF